MNTIKKEINIDEFKVIQEYNLNNQLTKETFYIDDETIDYIYECDPITGKMIKLTWFTPDGETVSSIREHDKDKGNFIKSTYYNSDGTTMTN